MSPEDVVERVLNRVRPLLQADGGDLEVVACREDEVHLRLTGECAACPQAPLTLHYGIELALRDAVPGLRVVCVS